MTTIRVKFEGCPHLYLATSRDLPGHEDAFAPMPEDVASLTVFRKRGLFINRNSSRRPREARWEEAKTWGKDDERDTELFYAQARTSNGSRFCLRLIPNTQLFSRDRSSNRYRVLNRLIKDAEFHSIHLSEHEGDAVPVHYGMWTMDTGDWAGRVVVSITQWCGMSWYELSRTKMNTEANRILIGRTFEALHDSGVAHGSIDDLPEFRHVLIDVNAPGLSQEDLLNGKAPCFIVGFSEAEVHKCTRKLPILPLDSFVPLKEIGCHEVACVLLLLNFLQTTKNRTCVSAAEAVEWHTKYSRLYPEEHNVLVAIAQRERLYPNMPRVYPGDVIISFEGDDDYSKAIIHRTFKVDEDEDEELAPDHIDSADETETTSDRVPTFRSDSSSPEPGVDVTEPVTRKLALVSLDDIPCESKV
ncbi:hypothetical protein DFH06DRAFT_1477758 [Mycena polygramma]|nr:hypothetical protein DFH06DRAFT_1477758 [Mycena polygramma]